jgi:hypothetical protein
MGAAFFACFQIPRASDWLPVRPASTLVTWPDQEAFGLATCQVYLYIVMWPDQEACGLATCQFYLYIRHVARSGGL